VTNSKRKFPDWLKRRVGSGETFNHTHHTLDTLGIETICTNANCPNRGECWTRGTATVLILGTLCTRNCKFCSVGHGKPLPPDATEPARVAAMAKELKLNYLVITCVNRDDLPDGGAGQFRNVINACRNELPKLEYELLVPDFRDCQDAALDILNAETPFVFGHNIETVPALYPVVRPGGNYRLSLNLLEKAKVKWPAIQTKSSIMLGLGETDPQVLQVLKDLRCIGCDRIALGQYLRPDKNSLDVVDYVHPDKFDDWAKNARSLGFTWVQSSPFTRSSFHAEDK
jgi:lipoic acid synthetase